MRRGNLHNHRSLRKDTRNDKIQGYIHLSTPINHQFLKLKVQIIIQSMNSALETILRARGYILVNVKEPFMEGVLSVEELNIAMSRKVSV